MPTYTTAQLHEGATRQIQNTPGVYLLLDADNVPVYIGKSIALQDRLRTYFNSPQRPKDISIVNSSQSVKIFYTAGEIGALLRETLLIKTHKPRYNRSLRGYTWPYVLQRNVVSPGYFSTEIHEVREIKPEMMRNLIVIDRSKAGIKSRLEDITGDYGLCPKLNGIDHSAGACFSYQIKKCRGACIGKESTTSYNRRFLSAFEKYTIPPWPYNNQYEYTEEGTCGSETFTFENWQLIKSTKGLRPSTFSFDYDIYRIIKRII